MLTRGESRVGDVAYPYSAKFYDGVADRIEHAAILLVLTFPKGNFVPDVAGLLCEVNQLAIICKNDQAFGVEIEASDGMKPAASRGRQQVSYKRAVLRVRR